MTYSIMVYNLIELTKDMYLTKWHANGIFGIFSALFIKKALH